MEQACVDIDECATDADNCASTATCTNTRGGFLCACRGSLIDVNGDGTECALPVTGIVRQREIVQQEPGGQLVTITCPDGKVAVNGEYGTDNNGFGAKVIESSPGDTASEWVFGINASQANTFTLDAICADVSGGIEVVTQIQEVADSTLRCVTATCPNGMAILGVGYSSNGAYTPSASLPDSETSWKSCGTVVTGGVPRIATYAVCAMDFGQTLRSSTGRSNFLCTRASCLSGFSIVTGGGDAVGDDLVSSKPTDFGAPNLELCVERGNQDEITATAICLPNG